MSRKSHLALSLAGLAALASAAPASAQYFGQNQVQYRDFDFQVLKTERFDIYYYPEQQGKIEHVARMAERWYDRLARVFEHDLQGRQALVFYASGADFRQTNVVPGIGEGTGGVVGYGAGSRDLPGHPNLLRLYLGEPLLDLPGIREKVLVLETHLDDMNPELYEPLMSGLFAARALDVALAPIQMKKNRPAVALTVIAPPPAREALLERLFADSTTLGVRILEVERVAARRWQETIATPYGPLEVKVMEYGGRRRLLPEYEACRRLAETHGLPLIEVYRLVRES